mgnify:CR=1 FL=1
MSLLLIVILLNLFSIQSLSHVCIHDQLSKQPRSTTIQGNLFDSFQNPDMVFFHFF